MVRTSQAAENDSARSGRESQNQASSRPVWKWIERALLIYGFLLLVVYGGIQLESSLSSRTALKSFAAHESSASFAATAIEEDNASTEIDRNIFNENPAHAYEENQPNPVAQPMGVLEIPKIHLAVPLLDETDALTLNHAVGRIAGTARPGEQGNIGIAGHRDGFFRGLKNVKLGDAIELRTVSATATYVVDQIKIVRPTEVSVLRPRETPSLTLVTCYPFSFIGSAPQRYIVMASLTHEASSGSGSSSPDSESQTSTIPKEGK
jgi:sortase A